MMTGEEVRKTYYDNYHYTGDESVVVDTMIFGDDIDWDALANLTKEDEHDEKIVMIYGNMNENLQDVVEFSQLIEDEFNLTCFIPFDTFNMNNAIRALVEKMNSAKDHGIDMSFIEHEVVTTTKSWLEFKCSTDEVMIRKCNTFIIINTMPKEDYQDVIDLIEGIAKDQGVTKNVILLIKEED